jgi:ABC-type branched-subunit amino acid transport system ATPase component/ABC-type branched-subunit amino acid transport system permease subunit
VIVLVARGTNLPGKGHVTGTLPSVGPGKITWRSLVWLGLGVVVLIVISPNWLNAVTTTMLAALIVLSVVFITGYAGQLSLAQTALAGVSAYLMALYSSYWGLPAWMSVLLSALAAIPAGLVMALPAIRTRGPNLAIATLTFVTVINALVLTDATALGPVSIHEIPTLSVFGVDVSEFDQPRRFALLVLGLFALCVVGVSNVRRGRSGRRMLAVRSNERAAASMGISGPSIKLYAFGVGAFIAGLAGALTESQFFTADFSLYTVTSSVDSVLQAVIGGLGWASGPMVGAANATGGFSAMVISLFFSASSWLDLITGVGVILIILQSPDGLVPFNIRQFRAAMHRLRRGRAQADSGRTPEKWLQADAGDDRPLTAQRPPVRLVMNDITVRFGGQVALDHVNVTVSPGQIVGLIGPNGAGKSTLIDVATGFLPKYSGSVLVDDVTMPTRGPVVRARQGLARSFQGLELFDHMTVLDNLRVASDAVTPWTYCRDFVKPGSSPSSQVVGIVHEFGLEPFLYSVPGELDYAHRRLVAIARALCSSPSMLLLDEPAAGLDSNERQELSAVIRSVVSSRGIGVLLVEHDVDFVFTLCDSVVALDAGKVIATGVPRDVRRSPLVIDAYLGHAYVAASAVEGARGEAMGEQ